MKQSLSNLSFILGSMLLAGSCLALSSGALASEIAPPIPSCTLACDSGCDELSWYDDCEDPCGDPDEDYCGEENLASSCTSCECRGGAGVHVCYCGE